MEADLDLACGEPDSGVDVIEIRGRPTCQSADRRIPSEALKRTTPPGWMATCLG